MKSKNVYESTPVCCHVLPAAGAPAVPPVLVRDSLKQVLFSVVSSRMPALSSVGSAALSAAG